MATNKKNTKSVKKVSKVTNPSLVIDLTKATESYDVYKAFADAKINKYINNTEFDIIVDDITKDNQFTVVFMPEVKKPNIFKRFWNWITRKK